MYVLYILGIPLTRWLIPEFYQVFLKIYTSDGQNTALVPPFYILYLSKFELKIKK